MTDLRTQPHTITLILAAGLGIATGNIIVPALLSIATTYDAPYAVMSIAFSGYLAMTAIVQLFAGPLSDRYGRRPVLLGAVGIFVVASLGCAVAPTIEIFLAFRLAQGAIVSGAALSLVIVRDLFGPKEAASRLGYISSATALAPMLGPMVGGVLADWFGWSAIFWTFAGIGMLLGMLIWVDLGETNKSRSTNMLSQFAQYPDLVRAPRFWGYAICTSTSVGGFFIFLAFAPVVATASIGLSQTQLGVVIGTITVGFVVGTYLTGRFATRFARTTLMAVGRTSSLLGAVIGFALVAFNALSPVTLACSVLFVGFGNGLTVPSSNIGVMSVRPKISGSAAGFSGAMTVGLGAILSSIAALIVTPEAGGFRMYAMIFLTSLTGLLAALFVRHIDARRAAETQS